MIKYEVCLNQGNEALQTGKSITANEVLLTCDEKALAREIHHQNSLIPEDVAAQVLSYFGKAATQMMAMGFAIQFKDGQDVLMRIYPDVHLKGGNINLQRAQELIPGTTDLTIENAGELATKVGVSVKVRCETEVKFTDMLEKEGYNVERQGVVEKAYVPRSGDGGSNQGETGSIDQTGGNTGNGGSDNQGGNQGDIGQN